MASVLVDVVVVEGVLGEAGVNGHFSRGLIGALCFTNVGEETLLLKEVVDVAIPAAAATSCSDPDRMSCFSDDASLNLLPDFVDLVAEGGDWQKSGLIGVGRPFDPN